MTKRKPTKPKALPQPSQGGSYRREKDGSLAPAAPAAPPPPDKTESEPTKSTGD